MKKTTIETKIINVFLQSYINKKKINNIELHDLKNIFKVFGKINRIMIYDRKIMIRAFIEFENIKSVKYALKIINECSVNSFGKCKISLSEKNKLICKNNEMEFIDYSCEINFKSYKKEKKFGFENYSFCEEIDSRGCSEAPGFNSIVSCHSGFRKNKKNNFCKNKKLSFSFKEKKIHKSRKKLEKKSKVIIVSNLFCIFSVQEIVNLFSCFGDIEKIIYMKNKNNALIQFENLEYASKCIFYMNGQMLKKAKIKISYSEIHQELDLDGNMLSKEGKKNNQHLKIPKNKKRFLNKYQLKIVPPSKNILVITNKNSDFVIDYLNQYEKCSDFKISNSDYEDTVNILFCYSSIRKSIYVMSKCGLVINKEFKMILIFN